MYKKLFIAIVATVSVSGLFVEAKDPQGKGCGCPKPKATYNQLACICRFL